MASYEADTKPCAVRQYAEASSLACSCLFVTYIITRSIYTCDHQQFIVNKVRIEFSFSLII